VPADIVLAVLLRSLPVREPDRLATVGATEDKVQRDGCAAWFLVYLAWRLFESVGRRYLKCGRIVSDRSAQQVRFWRVSASLLSTRGNR
jgi:hypothetical protein